jgi:hypothetical protein
MVRDLRVWSMRPILERFPLLEFRDAPSVPPALRHPERVSHLGFTAVTAWVFEAKSGRRRKFEAMTTLMQHLGRRTRVPPDVYFAVHSGGTVEQVRWFNDLQRPTASPGDAMRIAQDWRISISPPAAGWIKRWCCIAVGCQVPFGKAGASQPAFRRNSWPWKE